MTIKIGDKVPESTLMTMTDEGPRPVRTADLFGGKKVVLFALPGAFTPTCSNQHAPGFIRHAADIKARGVDTIACLSVNDAFVMGAWGDQLGADNKVMMLADGNGDFTKSLGLDFDGSSFGMGVRSQRYAMLVEDGVMKTLHLEPNPGEAHASGAEAMLEALG
ncbi:MAG: peroxiredoxin [Parvularculales bacterium]